MYSMFTVGFLFVILCVNEINGQINGQNRALGPGNSPFGSRGNFQNNRAPTNFPTNRGPSNFPTTRRPSNAQGSRGPQMPNMATIQQMINQLQQMVGQSNGASRPTGPPGPPSNLNAPPGVSQRFGSFSPGQFSPPSASPPGFPAGTNQISPQGFMSTQWPTRSNFPSNPGPQMTNNMNFQPSGFNFPQGQQFLNPEPPSNNFNMPTGIDQQLGSFSPLGFLDGGNQGQPNNFNDGSFTPTSTQELQGVQNNFMDRFFMNPQPSTQPDIGSMVGSNGLSTSDFGSMFGLNNFSFMDTGSSSSSGSKMPFSTFEQTLQSLSGAMSPDQSTDPLNNALQVNNRLRETLMSLNLQDSTKSSTGTEQTVLDGIKRESSLLRNLLQQKLEERQKTSLPQDTADQSSTKNKFTTGLLLGALGAFILG